MKLPDQVILLTGGAGAIGRHLVEDLLPETSKLIVLDRDSEALGDLQSTFPQLACYPCDLANAAEVDDTVTTIYEEQPGITVVINNAGLIHSEPLVNLLSRADKKHGLETWKRTIDCNLNSVFYLTSCVVAKMVETRTKGVIINVSSISAHGNVGQSAYSAAKAAVNALTVTWAKELGMFGIRSAAIAPGFFDTSSTREALSEANLAKLKKQTPIGRLGDPHELTNAVRFIVENDFFTGRILELDGGLRI
jgi:3-oxoacyl-[acyl-carrier protein] reductase